jgi:hypothetical protein
MKCQGYNHTHLQAPRSVPSLREVNAQTNTWQQRVSVSVHNRQTISTKDGKAAAAAVWRHGKKKGFNRE